MIYQDRKSKEFVTANYNLNIQLNNISLLVSNYLKTKEFKQIFNKYDIKPKVYKEIREIIGLALEGQEDKNLSCYLTMTSYALQLRIRTNIASGDCGCIYIENYNSIFYIDTDIFTKEIEGFNKSDRMIDTVKTTTQAEYDLYYKKVIKLYQQVERLKDEINILNSNINGNLTYKK